MVNSSLLRGYCAVAAEEGKWESLLVSVVVGIQGAKIAISTYKRKHREVIVKNKKADGIVYIKDNGGNPTNGG